MYLIVPTVSFKRWIQGKNKIKVMTNRNFDIHETRAIALLVK